MGCGLWVVGGGLREKRWVEDCGFGLSVVQCGLGVGLVLVLVLGIGYWVLLKL